MCEGRGKGTSLSSVVSVAFDRGKRARSETFAHRRIWCKMNERRMNLSIADQISQWLRERVEEAGAEGIVVGLSGGVDSAVVAGLARCAVGENVLGALMPCHSQAVDAEYAHLVAEMFDIKTVTVNLGPVYDTFIATLPDTTPPGGDEIYGAGNFNDWDPAGTMLSRTDLFAQAGCIILTESGGFSRPENTVYFKRN